METLQNPVQPTTELQPDKLEERHELARSATASALALTSIVGFGQSAEVPQVPAQPRFAIDVETTQNTQQQTLTSRIDSDVLNDWARSFETDTQDSGESLSQVDKFIEDHLDVFKNPSIIKSVRVTGLASAEGDGANSDLDASNPKNEKLASSRGELASRALVESVQKRFGYDISTKLVQIAIEDTLTPVEMGQVDALAQKYSFSDTTEMIKLYNRGKLTKNAEVTEVLDALLKGERGALIEVDTEETVNVDIPGFKINIKPKPGPEDNPNNKERYSLTLPIGYIPEQPSIVEQSEDDGANKDTDTDPDDVPTVALPPIVKEPEVGGAAMSGKDKVKTVLPPIVDPPILSGGRLAESRRDPSQTVHNSTAYKHKQPLPRNYFRATNRPRQTGRQGRKTQQMNRSGRS